MNTPPDEAGWRIHLLVEPGGNPFAIKPQKPPRALHGARIREAQNMPQGMFCVHTHPPSVPDVNSIPAICDQQIQRPPEKLCGLCIFWWSRRESPTVSLASETGSGGAKQCFAKPRLRPASVPDGDSISHKLKPANEYATR
jgi:hypothetical protein